MAEVYTPTLRGRRLALELRRLRERSNLKQAEAARRLNWNRTKLFRIEEPSARPDPDDVRALLQLYGLDADRWDAILKLLEDSWQRGWWTAYGDAFTGSYVMLEDQAEEIESHENALIPGLLQTPDYAREILRLRAEDSHDLDRLVAARMTRKAILDRIHPPRVHLVVGEGAIRRRLGSADIMRKQMTALWSAAVERPNVTIQVVPFDAPVTRGLEGPFTIFGFPQDRGLDVGHSEGQLGEWYAESTGQLEQLRLAFAGVCDAALSPDQTIEFLAALARE